MNMAFDEERALYGTNDALVRNCRFTGPADGESALKECARIRTEDCVFDLRYPLWHVRGLEIEGCRFTENARAALWYSSGIAASSTVFGGVKAFRECSSAVLEDCTAESGEFGWFCRDFTMKRCTLSGEYAMMHSSDVCFENVAYKGRYGLQYIEGGEFSGCDITSRDAFWHARGVTVRDSILRGEFLGWYSHGLTLVNCRIISSQPLCYCTDLRLVGCELTDCDLCFEKSDLEADITAPVESIKNPRSGRISVPAVEELVMTDAESTAEIIITSPDLQK